MDLQDVLSDVLKEVLKEGKTELWLMSPADREQPAVILARGSECEAARCAHGPTRPTRKQHKSNKNSHNNHPYILVRLLAVVS